MTLAEVQRLTEADIARAKANEAYWPDYDANATALAERMYALDPQERMSNASWQFVMDLKNRRWVTGAAMAKAYKLSRTEFEAQRDDGLDERYRDEGRVR